MPSIHIHWYRNDLRTDDHPAVDRAMESDTFLPVFIWQPQWYTETEYGFRKAGPRRARFLHESLAALDDALRALGSGLLVLKGRPEVLLPLLAQRLGADRITAQAEHTHEELEDETRVQEALRAAGAPALDLFEGLTMIHPAALPFPVEDTPDVFGGFRRKVEKHSAIREPLPKPEAVPTWPGMEALSADLEALGRTRLPACGEGLAAALPRGLADLGFSAEECAAAEANDARSAFPFSGGQAAARARLEDYVFGRALVANYKKTRNGLIGEAYSSKISAWLANGSLSPRRAHEAVKTFEAQNGGNQSTYWLIFELLWRDFFRFQAMKVGRKLFLAGGIQQTPRSYRNAPQAFDGWCNGKSGHAFIDANMIELAQTGWMSNRGRQNVASWLVRDLDVDWRWGAAWFEHHLLDYDPCSNYGNWQYVAGVGHDPRGDRRFDPDRQAWTYDRKGRFVETWLPERQTKVPQRKLFG
jgi:deoxyribodipyrimidine photo-lyase